MTPEEALVKRIQMERDGSCVIDDIPTTDFLWELRVESAGDHSIASPAPSSCCGITPSPFSP